MIIKTEEQLNNLKKSGEILRKVLDEVSLMVKPGVGTRDLNTKAEELVKKYGGTSSFLNYKPSGSSRKFPATICVSINNEIVHGIPNESNRMLKDGDIVSLDLGVIYNGMHSDSATTLIAGTGDEKAHKLLEATKNALKYAIIAAFAGVRVGDIGAVIEEIADKNELTIPPELGGHGLGESPHEEPFIPNIGDSGHGDILEEGQVIAIEPIFTEGVDPRIKLGKNNFTYETLDSSRAAHFEHTIVIQKSTPILITGALW